jgi:5-methylcytosine-specific restriction protein A
MVFSDLRKGARFGYALHDGETSDGRAFNYTGAGQDGDQQFKLGNKTLLSHKSERKRLQLFVADGVVQGTSIKRQKYMGEYEVRSDDELGFHFATAPDSQGRNRKVIVFHLERVSTAGRPLPSAPAEPEERIPLLVPTEVDKTLISARQGTEDGEAHRREAQLTTRFTAWLRSQKREARRWSIPLAGGRSMLTDFFTPHDNTLYEAKASASRTDIRMAIGQLLDYAAHLEAGIRLSVLLPARPVDDLIHLLQNHGFGCLIQDGSGFSWIAQPRG